MAFSMPRAISVLIVAVHADASNCCQLLGTTSYTPSGWGPESSMPPRCCRSVAEAALAAGGQAPPAAASEATASAAAPADDAGKVRQRPLRRRRVVQQLPAGLQPRRRSAVRARRCHVLRLVSWPNTCSSPAIGATAPCCALASLP